MLDTKGVALKLLPVADLFCHSGGIFLNPVLPQKTGWRQIPPERCPLLSKPRKKTNFAVASLIWNSVMSLVNRKDSDPEREWRRSNEHKIG
jgi:hypothetical protein